MKISELDPNLLTHSQVERLLFTGTRDDYKNGDCILVFGSKHSLRYRLPRALKLYKEKRAPLLLFSGGKVLNSDSEAEIMKKRALSSEVPESAILIEDKSTNTKENVLLSVEVLKQKFPKENLHVLLVTTLFHMKRCILTAKTYFPEGYSFSPCPAVDSKTLPGIWWRDYSSRNRALNEAKNLIKYVKSGELKDSEF